MGEKEKAIDIYQQLLKHNRDSYLYAELAELTDDPGKKAALFCQAIQNQRQEKFPPSTYWKTKCGHLNHIPFGGTWRKPEEVDVVVPTIVSIYHYSTSSFFPPPSFPNVIE